MMSIRRRGSQTCSPGSTITTSRDSTSSCPGIGRTTQPNSRPEGRRSAFSDYPMPRSSPDGYTGFCATRVATPCSSSEMSLIQGQPIPTNKKSADSRNKHPMNTGCFQPASLTPAAANELAAVPPAPNARVSRCPRGPIDQREQYAYDETSREGVHDDI